VTRKKSETAGELVMLPLGGVGEIGMNLMLYGLGPADARQWLMVDCGISFAGTELPGVDLVLPDISFIEAAKDRLCGILITHAHEDHYGALNDLWPRLGVPVYMTPFAAALHVAKRDMEPGAPRIPISVVEQGQRFSIGPFDIEIIPVSHSLPEPCSVFLRTPYGTVLHTGDWKIDHDPRVGKPIDLVRLAAIGNEGVDTMVCDSTNALRAGRSPSEGEVAHGIAEVIARAKRRVAVTIFASNVGRIRSIAEAAAQNDREVVVVGRAIKRVIDVAGELGMLEGLPPFRDEEAFAYLPADKMVAIVTGSQGEARAALNKIAAGEHRNVSFGRGDMVIFSSRTIPGNEKAVGAIKNKLVEAGVQVVVDGEAIVHTSGHPRRDEMMELYRLVRPRVAIPVHGEALHLASHEALAREAGVGSVVHLRNGDMVRIGGGDIATVDQVPVGVLVKDGRLVRDPEASGVVERRKMSFAGVVVCTLVMDKKGEILGEYALNAFGLPETDDKGEDMEDVLAAAVDGCLVSIPKARRKDEDLVAEAVRRSIRAAANDRWGKKPLCEVTVLRVE
jgi:ribonuclease J